MEMVAGTDDTARVNFSVPRSLEMPAFGTKIQVP